MSHQLLNYVQEYEWPDGSVEVGGADFDMWNTIGEGLNFNFRQEFTFNYFIYGHAITTSS